MPSRWLTRWPIYKMDAPLTHSLRFCWPMYLAHMAGKLSKILAGLMARWICQPASGLMVEQAALQNHRASKTRIREKPSDLEQKLAAWLVACEAVQPTDIVKLKRSDYAVELKPSGGLLMMQNRYYKGRSGVITSLKFCRVIYLGQRPSMAISRRSGIKIYLKKVLQNNSTFLIWNKKPSQLTAVFTVL